MTEREDTIERIERVLELTHKKSITVTIPRLTAERAVALLKEQEAVEPKYNARTNWYECGACHHSMTSGMHCRSELIPAYKVGFCAKCGKAVKWKNE